jgi:hypothetical protein
MILLSFKLNMQVLSRVDRGILRLNLSITFLVFWSLSSFPLHLFRTESDRQNVENEFLLLSCRIFSTTEKRNGEREGENQVVAK